MLDMEHVQIVLALAGSDEFACPDREVVEFFLELPVSLGQISVAAGFDDYLVEDTVAVAALQEGPAAFKVVVYAFREFVDRVLERGDVDRPVALGAKVSSCSFYSLSDYEQLLEVIVVDVEYGVGLVFGTRSLLSYDKSAVFKLFDRFSDGGRRNVELFGYAVDPEF